MVSLSQLQKICFEVRQDIIKMVFRAGSGHLGGSLSIVEILTVLFFGKILRYNPKKPDWSERDRFFLSKAHACPALYSIMARAGFFSLEELKTLRRLKSRLQGHLDKLSLPYIESTAGSLGQGLSLGVGAALAAKLDEKDYRVYVLMSDGEQEEGQIWEAVMTANHYDLDNLIGIIDVNGLQIDGWTEHIKNLENLKQKYESFGWKVIEVDGHNLEELIDSFRFAWNIHQQPKVILAYTTKGKGVSFMENQAEWHSRNLTKSEMKKALAELEKNYRF